MAGILIVGCGGYGRACVKAYSQGTTCPVLLVDRAPFADSLEENEKALILSENPNENESRLSEIFSGYTYILSFLPLGGRSVKSVYNLIFKCASMSGSYLITLCTVSYSFESERREIGLASLSELAPAATNLFVLDLQKTLAENRFEEKYGSVVRALDIFVTHMLGLLAHLLEACPFFTYCSNPAYTFSIGTGNYLSDAVEDALSHPLYDVGPSCGKILVFTEMDSSEQERDKVTAILSARGNALPELINGPGLGQNKVLLLIPISFPQHG